MKQIINLFAIAIFSSCGLQVPQSKEDNSHNYSVKDSLVETLPIKIDSVLNKKDKVARSKAIDIIKSEPLPAGSKIDVKAVNPDELIRFAETLVGTPYVYGSTDPKVGFDCSGFITYVFNHFRINVPRSSSQFSNVGKTVQVEDAKRGDIILFTNPGFTNTNSTLVGHMGLILSNNAGLINFIHSTSGKAMSVAITPLNEHYKKRFVRVSRIFPQNN
ncbi:MAG: C40 family peptidase [Flavitalea sp.]